MEGYLSQPRDSRVGLGHASIDLIDIVDSPWETSPFLRSGWWLSGEKMGVQEDSRESWDCM